LIKNSMFKSSDFDSKINSIRSHITDYIIQMATQRIKEVLEKETRIDPKAYSNESSNKQYDNLLQQIKEQQRQIDEMMNLLTWKKNQVGNKEPTE
jgi:uncharacterized protein (DUF1778 family)